MKRIAVDITEDGFMYVAEGMQVGEYLGKTIYPYDHLEAIESNEAKRLIEIGRVTEGAYQRDGTFMQIKCTKEELARENNPALLSRTINHHKLDSLLEWHREQEDKNARD